jgi:hypothetical protein
MNKSFTLLFSLLFVGASVFSQQDDDAKRVEFSVRIAPILSMPSARSESADWNFSAGDATPKFSGGISVDKFMQDNIALSFGVWYTGKRSTINFTTTENTTLDYSGTADYNLQYIEFPLLFKGFTNNITEKMKIYFQLGGTFGIKLSEQYAGSDLANKPSSMTYAKWYDTSILLGLGVEFNVGTSNKFYTGIDFSQGLTNIVKEDYISGVSDSNGDRINAEDVPNKNDYKIKNAYLALVLGFKF